MLDKLERELIEKFRELTPENQAAAFAYLAEILSEPETFPFDRH